MTIAAIEKVEASSIEQVEQRVQHEKKAQKSRDRIAEIVLPVLAVAGMILAWEVGVDFFKIPTYLFPAPSSIIKACIDNGPLLLRESWVTTIEITLGYLLSIAVGIPLAFGIFQWPIFARTVYPLLISTQAMPKVAIAPLFVVWFGFGFLPKILIAFLIAFFPIVINTVMGLTSMEREKIYLARSMGLSRFGTFRLIRLPNALPSIFAGLKISITLAVVGAVVGEFVGGDAGLGYQLMIANGSLNTPLLFAGVLALTVLGLVFFAAIEFLERLAIPHQERADGASAGTM
ncbi:NitT/TauT family transport system permease protein [Nitrobacteraceae bacterium AZCC 2146]